jgi:transposase
VGGEERGYDGGKKVKGRKRHILVDTEGFVLRAKVHSAKIMDYEGIKTLLHRAQERFPRLSHLWLDAGYPEERTRARTGSKRRWGGAWISSSVRKSPLPKRCSYGVGEGMGQRGREGGLAETDAP